MHRNRQTDRIKSDSGEWYLEGVCACRDGYDKLCANCCSINMVHNMLTNVLLVKPITFEAIGIMLQAW